MFSFSLIILVHIIIMCMCKLQILPATAVPKMTYTVCAGR